MKKNYILTYLFFIAALFVTNSQSRVSFHTFNGNANDETGNGYNGEIFNATLTEDRLGNTDQAFLFGNDQYIKVLNGDNMNVFTNSISISCWVNPTQQNSLGAIVAKWPVVQEKDQFGVYLNNMKPVLAIGHPSVSVSGVTFDFTLNVNEWYFLTFTWSNGIHRLYVNGTFIEEIDNQNFSNISPSSDADLFIGKDGEDRYYIGKIDEVSIFSEELTASQVQTLYDNTLHVNQASFQNIKVSFINGKIELSDTKYSFNIYDTLGRKRQNKNLSNGIYVIRIFDENNAFTKKVLLSN